MRTLTLAPLLLLACSDYEVIGRGEGVPIGEECEVQVATPGTVQLVDECLGADTIAPVDPWNLSVEWSEGSVASVVVPVVGNLTDDNGDNLVDDGDIPDIVVANYSTGHVTAISGDGSGVLWSTPGARYDAGVAIGDVDRDGKPEVVAVTSGNGVMALDGATGAIEWTNTTAFPMLWPVITIADLKMNGRPMVIADAAVVDGATGATEFVLPVAADLVQPWRSPVVADIDVDGDQEIILGPHVFDSDGALLWTATGTGTSCFGAIANLDTDDEAEIIFAYGSQVLFYEHNGTLRGSAAAGAANPGPPCVGDLDGDGEAEIVVPAGNALRAYEADGTPKWNQPIQDNSGAAGCSVFDMNADGIYEVIQADETALRIFDGATGMVHYTNTAHSSVTYFEYPVIVDVDGDGSAEIITSSSATGVGITVFGHNGDGWPYSGPNWQLPDFAVTNVTHDNSVPSNPSPSWLEHNVFRGRPSTDFPAQADLTVELVDSCVSSCEPNGEIVLSFRASNQGEQSVEAGVRISVYVGDERTRISTQSLPELPAGTTVGGTFLMAAGDVGTGDLFVVVDSDAALAECDEENNELRFAAPCE